MRAKADMSCLTRTNHTMRVSLYGSRLEGEVQPVSKSVVLRCSRLGWMSLVVLGFNNITGTKHALRAHPNLLSALAGR